MVVGGADFGAAAVAALGPARLTRLRAVCSSKSSTAYRDHQGIGEAAETHRSRPTGAIARALFQRRSPKIPHLYAPYEDTFLRYVARGPMNGDPTNHLCAQMMLDLGCSYW